MDAYERRQENRRQRLERAAESAAQRRVQDLGKLAERVAEGPTRTEVGEVTIVADPETNRVLIYFPRRLTDKEYRRVRSFSFKWSHTRKAFTRQMGGTKGAEYAAQMLADGFRGEV
jgi:hypothetical protein